ncbi:ATP-binding protein [Aliiglaciecola sp.]|nr:ATP-binding protein [Aliiglaciecola sp.]
MQDDGCPYYDKQGNFLGYVGSCFDITQKKQLLDSLENSQAELKDAYLRLNETIKSGNIGLWEWDLQSNQAKFSSEYLHQIGYKSNELLHCFETFQSRIHPDDLGATLQLLQKNLDSGARCHEVEFRFRHKDGHYLWILSQASIIRGKDGKVSGMLGSHIDITERKKMESQLRQKYKMEAIGQLSGGVAHDFNNQIGSIMGFAELIAHSNDIQTTREYARSILSCAEHSSDLTKQLLNFSRKEDLKLEPIDIHLQIQEVFALLNCSSNKKVRFEIVLDAQHSFVLADKSMVQNAVLNLCLNAIDAVGESGSVTIASTNIDTQDIESHLGIKAKAAPYLLVEVIDNGCGIPEENLPKLFEPFFTSKEFGEGTGLGLSTVYAAVEQLKGRLLVESDLGIGSRFKMYLPSYDEKQLADVQNQEQVEADNKQSFTILVVDDESMIREMCAQLLTHLGHQVHIASGGDEAIKLYAVHQDDIDLVILDQMMPNKTGEEVLVELKAIKPQIRTTISSGNLTDAGVESLTRLGVSAVLDKPYRLAQLDNCIKETMCDSSATS